MRCAALLVLVGCSVPDPVALSAPGTREIADARVGRWMRYVTEGSGVTTVKVVARTGDGWWIEEWKDADGVLVCVSPEGKVVRAWSAAKGDRRWRPMRVGSEDGFGFEHFDLGLGESKERKSVKAGEFDCTHVHGTPMLDMNVPPTWFSKDVWTFHEGDAKRGGLVAIGDTTWLDATGEDARPTMPLP